MRKKRFLFLAAFLAIVENGISILFPQCDVHLVNEE